LKLWGGRFTKKTAHETSQFLDSLRFDARLYKEDIRGSIAHARMLGRQGIITTEEADLLVNGLIEILEEIKEGKLNPLEGRKRIYTPLLRRAWWKRWGMWERNCTPPEAGMTRWLPTSASI